ncbi:uracil-DNA glycosylase family protein [Muricauda ruestringensis]|uniref:uracil-DNA glycosylase family protein n=1 Tax=Flagellimonas ruestringensis TaxID=111501 RepID=UPI001CD6CE61|nr:uracil-DNA glycosylase family protein [Allomuricauda ruestringensis]MCA0959797.1 uracil-DNA glycosylase family protein [Allomuricauda ruestringensis]
MDQLLHQIQDCNLCEKHLALGPRPIVAAHPKSKIAIIGQAPGAKVHQTGVPWDDPSGKKLREWLNVTEQQFYNKQLFALIPMGFCYPGKGKSGDLPPRPECAPKWHNPLMDQMPNLDLIILIGQYAQNHYLGDTMKKNLTETVNNYNIYLPKYFVLPHPSPRNRFWLQKNPWFGKQVLPELQKRVNALIAP